MSEYYTSDKPVFHYSYQDGVVTYTPSECHHGSSVVIGRAWAFNKERDNILPRLVYKCGNCDFMFARSDFEPKRTVFYGHDGTVYPVDIEKHTAEMVCKRKEENCKAIIDAFVRSRK